MVQRSCTSWYVRLISHYLRRVLYIQPVVGNRISSINGIMRPFFVVENRCFLSSGVAVTYRQELNIETTQCVAEMTSFWPIEVWSCIPGNFLQSKEEVWVLISGKIPSFAVIIFTSFWTFCPRSQRGCPFPLENPRPDENSPVSPSAPSLPQEAELMWHPAVGKIRVSN